MIKNMKYKTLVDFTRENYRVYPEVLGYYYQDELRKNPEKLAEINEYDFVFVSSDFSEPIEGCDAVQLMTSSDSKETVMWLQQPFNEIVKCCSSKYTEVPTVGFVGRCPIFRTSIGNQLHKGFSERYTALKALGDSLDVCTDFHVRTEPAGDSAGFYNSSLPTYRKDGPLFALNMAANQYQVCARGNANWSLRFYETLRSGRIPVYIDSGGKFPLDVKFTPGECPFVWVSEGQSIVDEVLKFHNALDGDADLQWYQNECHDFFRAYFSQMAQIREFRIRFAEVR